MPAQDTKQAARVDMAIPAMAVRKKAANKGCQYVLAYSSVSGSAFSTPGKMVLNASPSIPGVQQMDRTINPAMAMDSWATRGFLAPQAL